MKKDYFKLNDLTAISFSGGRTSAYMLWRVLESNGGLPNHVIPIFANTGREAEETLQFVRDCGDHWNVPIVWIEYDDTPLGFSLVNFDTASRNGEPFEKIIRKRKYLPNPVTRFCTVELKIRAMHKYLKLFKWDQTDGWDQMIGIRADEPRRIAKIRARPSPETSKETMILPLADAGVTVHEVNNFWKNQKFNLNLATQNGRTFAGNCDLCFLKPLSQIVSLTIEQPSRPVWWARMENLKLATKPEGARFRNDRPGYSQISQFTVSQKNLFEDETDGIDCFCGE